MPTHHQVAHAWAHKTGKSKSGHHIYYDNDSIYSYGSHFCIARHITLPDNTPAILFTTRSYSQSTAQHKSIVADAASHIRTILVTHPNRQPSAADVDELLAMAQTQIEKANRARTRGAYHIDEATRLLEQANTLVTLFNLPRPISDLATLAPNLADIRDQAQAARAAEQARRVHTQLQSRLDWQAGHTHRFYGTDEHGNAYCRVYGDQLQTSMGASVPLEDAKRAFEFVAYCRAQSKTWVRTGSVVRVPVGDFQVDRIEPTGDFKAGCHTFSWPEIERVAKSIGVLP